MKQVGLSPQEPDYAECWGELPRFPLRTEAPLLSSATRSVGCRWSPHESSFNKRSCLTQCHGSFLEATFIQWLDNKETQTSGNLSWRRTTLKASPHSSAPCGDQLRAPCQPYHSSHLSPCLVLLPSLPTHGLPDNTSQHTCCSQISVSKSTSCKTKPKGFHEENLCSLIHS